jgi:hypothetical protein
VAAQVSKDNATYVAIGLGYVLLILSLFVAAIWTTDFRWAATALILILPSVIVALVSAPKKEKNL